MPKSSRFFIFVAVLMAGGSYGIFSIIKAESPRDNTIPATQADFLTIEAMHLPEQTIRSGPLQAIVKKENSNDLISTITKLLDDGQYQAAVDAVDDQYQRLSSEQLQNFKDLYLSYASGLKQSGLSDQAITLLVAFTDSFNNLEGWTLLSDIYSTKSEWLPAIDSLLAATALEYRPEQLERLMGNLTSIASQLRSILEGQKDELAINDLYRKLYQHHPGSARFQLELAMSYLRLQDINSGKGLLEPLQYDVEYGEIAKTALSLLEENLASQSNQPSSSGPEKNRNEIVVPLLRSGNSFFVHAVVNNQQLRLLLDTGASITALSEAAIDKLNLKSSGRFIRLNTANGVRQSELFRADLVKLGSLSIKNLPVAGIKFESNTGIDGLLGTDLLSQIDNRYSYVIDDQRNALIFISK